MSLPIRGGAITYKNKGGNAFARININAAGILSEAASLVADGFRVTKITYRPGSFGGQDLEFFSWEA